MFISSFDDSEASISDLEGAVCLSVIFPFAVYALPPSQLFFKKVIVIGNQTNLLLLFVVVTKSPVLKAVYKNPHRLTEVSWGN